jgi:hypothetical protein
MIIHPARPRRFARADWQPKLPDAGEYYRARLRGLRRANAKGYAAALCPFHEDREPSFSVDLTSGRWRCFGCGAHGDLVDFHMKMTGRNFRDALVDLGAIPMRDQRA